jgi:hypothetical protein
MSENTNYWQYETSIGNNTTISLRGRYPISKDAYMIYLDLFIKKYQERIIEVKKTDTIYPPGGIIEYCTILNLSGTDPILYECYNF